MAQAKLISDNGKVRIYHGAKGTIIKLEITDEWDEIIFRDKNGKKFGGFEFKELEEGGHKLMRMYTEPFKEEGIGRAALQFFKDYTNSEIYTSSPTGSVRDDGSHLTEDAPGFVQKMIKEGLIEGYETTSNYDDINGFFDE